MLGASKCKKGMGTDSNENAAVKNGELVLMTFQSPRSHPKSSNHIEAGSALAFKNHSIEVNLMFCCLSKPYKV